nr:reverse transcriptase domain-containing protein [Tanacetum cinerariifolium]
MRTRSSSNLIVESFMILKPRNRRRSKQIVEPELRSIVETPVSTMADTRTMSKLLQAPIEGYEDTIVIPSILAEYFELKFGLLSLVTSSQVHGCERDNSLTQSDQDSLNAAIGGNPLNRTPRVALMIIENKSKVCTLRNKPILSKVNTTTSSSSPSPDITALTDIVKELVLMNKANQQASVKAVEENCVTYGGPHPYYECLAIDGNTFDACAATGTYNQGANSRADLKDITTRSGVAYDGPTILPTPSPILKEVEGEIEATKDKVQATSSESTAHVQPPVVTTVV